MQFHLNDSVVPYSVMKFIVGASYGNVTCMALYLTIYPGRMEGPPTSASNYTPYWYNPVGSSTAVLSVTRTGGATYGISVNNSYTAVNTTSVPSQYPSASRTAREARLKTTVTALWEPVMWSMTVQW